MRHNGQAGAIREHVQLSAGLRRRDSAATVSAGASRSEFICPNDCTLCGNGLCGAFEDIFVTVPRRLWRRRSAVTATAPSSSTPSPVWIAGAETGRATTVKATATEPSSAPTTAEGRTAATESVDPRNRARASIASCRRKSPPRGSAGFCDGTLRPHRLPWDAAASAAWHPGAAPSRRPGPIP